MTELRSLTLKLAARYPVGSSEWLELPTRVADAWKDNYLRRAGEQCTFHFRNKALQDLWENELMGQISDGMWENTPGTGWIFWASLKQSVGGATKIEGPVPGDVRKSFNFASRELLDIIGDQMLEEIQKTEPTATGATLLKYLREIMQAMKGVETVETPAGATEAPKAMPDASAQIHDHRNMLVACFDAAKIPFNSHSIYGEAFSYAATGSRAGQYHFFLIISVNYGYTVCSAYGKLGRPPKAVVLGKAGSPMDAFKLVHTKVKAKLSSGYEISTIAGITKYMDPITGRVTRQSPTAVAASVTNVVAAALLQKKAADIRALLAQIFSGVQPHVRNWRGFLDETREGLSEWETTWGSGFSGVPKIETEEGTYTGAQIGGYGYKGNRGYDPPEYAEAYYQSATEGTMELKGALDLRLFPKVLLQASASLVSDKEGFVTAVTDMIHNREARTMFAKLLRASTMDQLKSGGGAYEYVYDTFLEAAEDADEDGWDISYSVSEPVAGASSFSFSGTSIVVSTNVSVTFEEEHVEAPEPDYDGPDDYDYDDGRYAAALNGLAVGDRSAAKALNLGPAKAT